MENLRELRIKANFNQLQAAQYFNISLRSYRDYENDASKKNSVKYKYFVESFNKLLYVDEETGLLTIDTIKKTCNEVFQEYDVKFCYLFGSYAKGKETPKSDVDLFIEANGVTGIKFFGLVEKLRVKLHKVVDLLDINQVIKNPELLKEILTDGIKIYGK